MGEKCIFCGKTENLTDEHIVPEGMGGALTIRAVCKDCNDRMGSDFEGPTINAFLFEAPRYIYGIKGKRTEPPNPFRAPGTLPNGLKVRLTDTLNPYLTPSVKEERLPDGSMKLSLALDARDEKDLERILSKIFRRYYREQANPAAPQDVESKTAAAVRQAKAQVTRGQNHQSVRMHFTVDLAALMLTYLKITYETCWHHFGERYLDDAVAVRMRDAINERQQEPRVHGQVPIGQETLCKLTFAEDCHSVMLIGNSCYINLFGLAGVIEACEQGGAFHLRQEDGVIYHFNYAKRSVVITPLVEHLANLSNSQAVS